MDASSPSIFNTYFSFLPRRPFPFNALPFFRLRKPFSSNECLPPPVAGRLPANGVRKPAPASPGKSFRTTVHGWSRSSFLASARRACRATGTSSPAVFRTGRRPCPGRLRSASRGDPGRGARRSPPRVLGRMYSGRRSGYGAGQPGSRARALSTTLIGSRTFPGQRYPSRASRNSREISFSFIASLLASGRIRPPWTFGT